MSINIWYYPFHMEVINQRQYATEGVFQRLWLSSKSIFMSEALYTPSDSQRTTVYQCKFVVAL